MPKGLYKEEEIEECPKCGSEFLIQVATNPSFLRCADPDCGWSERKGVNINRIPTKIYTKGGWRALKLDKDKNKISNYQLTHLYITPDTDPDETYDYMVIAIFEGDWMDSDMYPVDKIRDFVINVLQSHLKQYDLPHDRVELQGGFQGSHPDRGVKGDRWRYYFKVFK